MPDDGMFAPIFTTDELLEATGGQAWLQAMLDVERGLATVEARLGIVPPGAAAAIAAACDAGRFDVGALGRDGRLGGNPVVPLVSALRAAVPAEARDWVHWGATSQDILDSAAMLVAARAAALIDNDLALLAAACAGLAARHRGTLMAGRTLLQQALPTTFGLKAAGWLQGALDARRALDGARRRLAVQLGGAVGTLASLGDLGLQVLGGLAAELDLAEPRLPWHTARQRVAEVGAALALVAGTAAKIGRDVALLMQTEVAEAAEPGGPGRGPSSTMPHKRNPVGAAVTGAASRRTFALLPVMFGALEAEHERSLGGWHAEWESLTEMLRMAGGAAARARETVEGIEVDEAHMLENLTITGGALLSERVGMALTARIGHEQADGAVRAAVVRALASGRPFVEELLDDERVARQLTKEELEQLVDPSGYLGVAGDLIDRVLEAYHREEP